MFKKGMKVVSLDNFKPRKPYEKYESSINKGDVLTIREVYIYGLRFEEIHNPILEYSNGIKECAYDSKFFIPLEEKFEKITYSKVLEEIEICSN